MHYTVKERLEFRINRATAHIRLINPRTNLEALKLRESAKNLSDETLKKYVMAIIELSIIRLPNQSNAEFLNANYETLDTRTLISNLL